jgi:hypothetical protein
LFSGKEWASSCKTLVQLIAPQTKKDNDYSYTVGVLNKRVLVTVIYQTLKHVT